ncbi:uncharacterized protein [Dysidea avara]|uniref:uncharacterized protein n=1 Tax=Dysidea avara TaxID=196820 RepID=UPI00331FA666
MEDLTRLQASRKAYKSHVTRLYNKIDDLFNSETDDYTITTLTTAVEQLSSKQTKIAELDERITTLIKEPEELTEAMIEAGELEDSIMDKIAKVKRFIELNKNSVKPHTLINPTTQPSTEMGPLLSNPHIQPMSSATTLSLEASPLLNSTHQTVSTIVSSAPISSIVSLATQPTASSNATVTTVPLTTPLLLPSLVPATNTTASLNSLALPMLPETTITSTTSLSSHSSITTPEQRSHVHASLQSANSRLPKLTLPTFSGDPLSWQTFWDSFNAAVHTNPALGGIQKFNYLKAQLQGDAARAIAGLPLTELNYQHSVALLEERFGQPHKLINAHMQVLLDMPNATASLTSLRLLYDTVATHTRALASLGKSKDSYGDIMVSVILKKLPAEIRRNLAREQANTEWTFDDLTAAILKEIRVLESGYQPTDLHASSRSTATFYVGSKSNSPGSHSGTKKSTACVFCKGPHPSHSCVTTDQQARIDIVKKENLCFNCLGHHKISQCTSRFRCKKRHHTSLCSSETPRPNDSRSSNQGGASSDVQVVPATTAGLLTSALNSHSHNYTCLLKTAVTPVIAGSIKTQANILFDEGAQRSFISAELATELCIQPTSTQGMALASFGTTTASYQELGVATVEIETISGEVIPISVLVIPSIAAPIQSSINSSVRNMSYLQGLKLAHPVTSNHQFKISILIGTYYYWTFIQDHIVRGDGPTAQQSKLGYLLSGPVPSPLLESSSSVLLQLTSAVPTPEAPDLEQFWSVEAIGTTSDKSSDSSFLQTYQDTCVYQSPTGMYVARFPWKEDRPFLPSNFAICQKRTTHLLNKLRGTPQLLKIYDEIILEQERRGFIERINDHSTNNTHYLPHRPVKKDSTTTPIRIIYNCSCREHSNSPSLNDCLMVGPPFLNNLCAILLRFRNHNYALSTDIEKAFLHVQLHNDDRNFTRFLWPKLPDIPDSKFQAYRFAVVPFGSCSSPFMLAAVLNLHLNNTPSPIADDMKENLYVDNILSGCDTEEEVVQYYTQARTIMGNAKFNLRSWSSNSQQLQELVAKEKTGDPSTTVGILGLQWNIATDTLSLSPKKLSTNTSLLTKRDVLQTSSQIYDPLGWATPITIKAKILLQDIWQSKLSWDEPLPTDIRDRWIGILADLFELPKLTIPRPYFTPSNRRYNTCNMYVFSDASTKAYGTVVYLCQQGEVCLVMSKSRVAPTRTVTLPKLELMAAVMASRLANFVKSSLHSYNLSTNTHLWTDSQIVLYWIYKQTSSKPFINHRVTEIVNSFPPKMWSFTPTSDNPADLLTRGISAQQLFSSQLWLQGPCWLPSESEWPKWLPTGILHINIAEAEEEVEVTTPEGDASITTGISNVVTITRHSNIYKLLAVTAYVLRFTHNLFRQHTRLSGPLSASELQAAKKLWISSSQHSCFKEELSYLMKRSKHHCPTLVKQLRLFLDKSNLIRCGGRMHNAPVADAAKFPILLPPKHLLTDMFIQQTHKKLHHAGVSTTVTALRQVFWIPTIRQRVKKQLRQCVTCNRLMGKPYQAPDPPPLPRMRVEASQPFKVTGVDFTGALYVRDTTGERKITYACLPAPVLGQFI